MTEKKGKFITLEGSEGTGKTTQLKLLITHMKKRGIDFIQTREPGGTKIGDTIRRMLLSNKSEMSSITETLLYMASRSELVSEVIKPALDKGVCVVSDRWVDATLAYQGYGLGVDPQWIQAIAKEVVRDAVPDLTLLLDLSVAKGLGRAKLRGKLDRIELRSTAFHQRVHMGYRKIAKQHSRFRQIAVTDIESTHRKIVSFVDKLF
ncbi:MAG: dTMP kinase [Candidatus Omnitrophota bacterium]|jgi:dTMP kinase